MRRTGFLFSILFIFSTSVSAQTVTLNGYFEDELSHERLAYAAIYDSLLQKGAIANDQGFFSLSLPAGRYNLTASHVGYHKHLFSISLQQDTTILIPLTPKSTALDEIEVLFEEMPTLSSLNMEVITPKEIRVIPVVFGEKDALKALQLLPGVQSGTEGSAGLYIRGGGPDQNLVLLDGAPIYHAAHLFGFFSVFNTDAIQSVRLIKGGFPARYGGRLSSVIDIDTRDGNLQQFAMQGGISPIASRVTVEGPLIKDKSSYIISGRRTFLDVLFRPSLRDEFSELGYYFYDLNGKATYIFSDKSRLTSSFYTGTDKYFNNTDEEFIDSDPLFTDHTAEGLNWRNTSVTLKYTQLLSPKLFLTARGVFTKYHFQSLQEDGFIEGDVENIAGQRYQSAIKDLAMYVNLDYSPLPEHAVKTGFSIIHHTFNPGIGFGRSRAEAYTSINESSDINAVEAAGYLEDELQFLPGWHFNIGVHVSAFDVEHTRYTSLQPRISTRFLIQQHHSLTASFTRMRQYLHLLAPSGLGMPTDLWLPSTARVKPQNAFQATFGYAINGPDMSIGIEGFYKGMDHLLEYKEGASFSSINLDWQEKVTQGDGYSRGLEFLLRKKTGKLTGMIGYTLSQTRRTFATLNEGNAFPYRYDRTHDLSVLLNAELSERKSISVSWVYGTGHALSAPTGWYVGPQQFEVFTYYPSRGNYRAPAFHRLNLSYRIKYEPKWGKSELGLNIYNAYNRKNPFYIYQTEPFQNIHAFSEEELPGIKQISLVPIIPSIDYTFFFQK